MTRMSKLLIAGFSLFFAAVATVARAAPSDDDRVRLADCPELEALESRWRDAMQALDVPDFAIVVVQGDDVILLDAFGNCDPEKGRAATPDTMYYIASCTKVYLATAIQMLAGDGKLALDDPIKKHLPRFTLAEPAQIERLTLRDLLCHRPGLNDGQIVFADAYTGQITEDFFYKRLAFVKPAGQVRYSNLHFTLLGRVVEAVSGKSWKDFLAERLFGPAGMTRTTAYASRMYRDPDVALPLVYDGERWVKSPVIKTDRTMHAAGGLGTTARDLGRFLRMSLNGGSLDGKRFLSAAAVEQMLTQQSKDGPEGEIRKLEGYGLGWRLGTYRGRPYATHGGGYIGTAAHISMLPEDRLAVGILANAESAPPFMDVISIDVYDHLLGLHEKDLLPGYKQRAQERRQQRAARPQVDVQPLTAAQLSLPAERYAGVYQNEDWGTVEFRIEGGNLIARIGDLPPKLHAGTEKDRFGVTMVPTDQPEPGRFEIADGKVTAVDMPLMGESVMRFVRVEK